MKGENASYSAIHTWVKGVFGKATHCENCGAKHIPKGKKRFFEWANISGKYKRDITDWWQLCIICHRGFDKKAKIPKSETGFIKTRYNNGESQKSIAKDYGVCQMTISDIVNNKIQSYAF